MAHRPAGPNLVSRGGRGQHGTDPDRLELEVAFLRDPGAYPERPASVEAVETHMSWVFLTDRLVYKLKKPIRYDVLDFSTLERRRRSCRREVRLNRRLAPDVYLGVVALTVEPDGRFHLGGGGEPVDWLVKMRRLPEDRMLERLIVQKDVRNEDVEPAAELLAGFYAGAVPAPVDGGAYRRHLREGIRADRQELTRSIYGLAADDVRRIADEQLAYVARARATLDRRVRTGHVVEGHGDLRPEHIFLTDPPVVIDCLEFSRDLRVQDPFDELSFLALECTRLGEEQVGRWFLDLYRSATGDRAPPHLLGFYWRYRALRRAKVAVWHLRDHGRDDVEKWQARARWYLCAADLPPNLLAG